MKTLNSILAFALLATSSSCAHASPIQKSFDPIPYFAGLDVYGTDRVNADDVTTFLGNDLNHCMDFYIHQSTDQFEDCRKQLLSKIQSKYHFAFADLSIIRYYNIEKGSPVYATLDVVEPQDQKTRMDFLPKPSQIYNDPDGLFQAWDKYLKTGFELLSKGEITGTREDCPAFHCIFGHKHPRLAPYEKIFVEGVQKNQKALEDIFLNDGNDHHRADAAFLLAYGKSGSSLIQILSRRMADDAYEVRNNVMRVFSDISNYHRELELPMDAVFKALDFPMTTDRNKTSAVILWKLTDSSDLEKYRETIMKKGAPFFLKMLRLKQPNNHDSAYQALKLLSGKDFGERDYESWEKWYVQSLRISTHKLRR